MFNKSSLFTKPETPSQRASQRIIPSSGAGTADGEAAFTAEESAATPAGRMKHERSSVVVDRRDDAKKGTESAQESESRLIVGPNVKLKGAEILDCDTLVVEGRVEATMDSRVIRITENGSFSGTVSIDVAEIYGHFEGDLTVRSKLVIYSTGRVSGKVRYGKILIEEGGEISGDIQTLGTKSQEG